MYRYIICVIVILSVLVKLSLFFVLFNIYVECYLGGFNSSSLYHCITNNNI